MPVAEGIAPPLQRFTEQRLGSDEVALGMQQHAEVVGVAERARMPVAEYLARRLFHCYRRSEAVK